MSREEFPAVVGNEFVVQPQRAAAPARPRITLPLPIVEAAAEPIHAEIESDEAPAVPVSVVMTPALAAPAATASLAVSSAAVITKPHHWQLPPVPASVYPKAVLQTAGETLHRHTLISFALLFLLVGASGTVVAGRYMSAHIDAETTRTSAAAPAAAAPKIAGFNMTVPAAQLNTELAHIAAQSATLTVGSQTAAVSPATIKSWIKVSPSADKTEDYLRVEPGSIVSSIKNLADQYVEAPVNQVSVTHTDGSPSGVIVAGQNGTQLSDPNGLTQQAQGIAKNLMGGAGFHINTPLSTVPFQSVTPAAFPKLLEVNLTTKRLYAYQNGQLLQTFLVSAGKPSTPTPTGEFKIWDKLTSQTMTGPGYVQPNVPYVNYFDHSGDAVHGVYWRPASVFGNVNTSHGCVGISISNAEWVYNWAPIGTTVITYNQPISS